MDSLQIVQNKAAKVILGLPVFSSSSEALNELGWKTLESRRKFYLCTTIYKLCHGQIDHVFSFMAKKELHSHDTRRNQDLHLPKP